MNQQWWMMYSASLMSEWNPFFLASEGLICHGNPDDAAPFVNTIGEVPLIAIVDDDDDDH